MSNIKTGHIHNESEEERAGRKFMEKYFYSR